MVCMRVAHRSTMQRRPRRRAAATPRRQISKRLASRRSIQARPPMRLLNCFAFALLGSASVAAAELPIFDAHVHYSHDAWGNVPPKIAIELLRKAGIKRALV